ncbi:MAG: type II secretion system protein, partial [Planctomycetota bacterium]
SYLLWTIVLLVIVGVLAAFIVPQFQDVNGYHTNPGLRSQVQTVRSLIELYNVQNPVTPFDETTPVGPAFWDPLVQGDYLQAAPQNSLQHNSTLVASFPRQGAGWIWGRAVLGDPRTLNIYAVDEDGKLFSDPDTGQPY